MNLNNKLLRLLSIFLILGVVLSLGVTFSQKSYALGSLPKINTDDIESLAWSSMMQVNFKPLYSGIKLDKKKIEQLLKAYNSISLNKEEEFAINSTQAMWIPTVTINLKNGKKITFVLSNNVIFNMRFEGEKCFWPANF